MALSAEVRDHWKGQFVYWRLMAKGAAWLAWLLLAHGGEVRKFRTPQPTEGRYQRPPRRYDLPPYEEGMAHCRSRRRDPSRGRNTIRARLQVRRGTAIQTSWGSLTTMTAAERTTAGTAKQKDSTQRSPSRMGTRGTRLQAARQPAEPRRLPSTTPMGPVISL